MRTQLLYLQHMDQLTCTATVEQVFEQDGHSVIVLNQTVFYPQGGGQPYDQGQITAVDDTQTVFQVDEVRFVEGLVHHIGQFSGTLFTVGATVACQVDPERRALHARLHSAGHVLDMALDRLGITWEPGKGYHFPDGPYVEYAGSLDGKDVEQLRAQVETMCNKLLHEGTVTTIQFMDKADMHTVCRFVPDYLPVGKPARVVLYGSFGVPCGGTHVAQLSDIGSITIRKMKQHKDRVKVAYQVGDVLAA